METAIAIRELGPGDDAWVANVAADVFDHRVEPHLTTEFLNDPRHHLVAAIDADRIVGFVSAVHYVHPDKPRELWINEVSVASTHRDRGIAKRLMRAMLDVGDHLGCHAAWVLTDRANVHAMRLYAGCGGVAAQDDIVMFEFALRSQDLR
jgi:ribosomal protein S18 acetylase RimI-like enzyme